MLVPGSQAELIAHVVRCGEIRGKVTHPDGSPAPGILVEAAGVGGPASAGPGRARTDANGSFTMELPPEQSYMVT